MNAAQFAQYKKLKDSGRRSEAAAALASFIASFSSMDEKRTWTHWYLEAEHTGNKIRHELYEQVIFPILVEGHNQNDPWSLRWLARTAQNLYQAKKLWSQVEFKSEMWFLKDLFAICPDDDAARTDLVESQLSWFGHCVHEWPAGIIYGMDGATSEECEEILAAIAETRVLDRELNHTAFLDEFEARVIQYKTRIKN